MEYKFRVIRSRNDDRFASIPNDFDQTHHLIVRKSNLALVKLIVRTLKIVIRCLRYFGKKRKESTLLERNIKRNEERSNKTVISKTLIGETRRN